MKEQFDTKPYTTAVYFIKWNGSQIKEQEFTVLKSGCFIGYGNRKDILSLYKDNLIKNRKDIKAIFKLK